MKIGILKYPGGHGEAELIHILSKYFKVEVSEIWYKDKGPFAIDVLFLGGGFPCIERNGGRDCLKNSPAINYLTEFAEKGKYIAGFGNAFQLLCEASLLPGELRKNTSGKFICKQVYMKAENRLNAFTNGLRPEEIYRIPIATNYGNYFADESELVRMRNDGQILFRFCDYDGRITEAVNYTGSIDNIAGVCNAKKNVFGIIPQPERAVTEYNSNSDGHTILGSFLEEVFT